jgi:uncharacterized protein (TIGR03083 family)
MELTRTEIIAGMLDEYRSFAELVGSLDEAAWAKASRCDGFDVRDVAGHVIGLAEDVVAGVPGSRTAEQEAASVRDDAPEVAASRLRSALEALGGLAAALDTDEVWDGPSGLPDLSMGDGVLTLWYDTYVHGDDIRAAIGLPPATGPGLRAAVRYLEKTLTDRGWGPAHLRFTDQDDDFGELVVGTAATTLPVDALEFVLAATGRVDPTSLGLHEDVNIYAA